MDALIISDTHGSADRVAEILRRACAVSRPDAVFFLGDGLRDLQEAERLGLKVCAVAGNCDMFSDAPPERVVFFGGKRILLLHGHTRGVKHGTDALLGYALKIGADAALYGHTHVRDLRIENGVTLFNPGSVGFPERGAPSFGTLSVKDGNMLFSFGEL
ncbi:MAG: YfcE family phosphodiesterase [Clostridia bacterium]|nr:YfcE family phosphodiesterase [Clostridia bacterium]